MLFDTNEPGKYIFDSRQKLTSKEYSEVSEEYLARLRSHPSNAYKDFSITNIADKANLTVTYIIIGLAVILPLLSWFVFFKGSVSYIRTLLTIGVTLTGIGIMLIAKVILRFTVKKRIYSETVDAECIGYARCFESGGSSEGTTNCDIPCVSPVFTYHYEGVAYTCCYDGFTTSKDSNVPLGPAKINISPEHPESIYNPTGQQKDVLILFAVVFFLAGTGLTIAGLMV